MKEIVFVPESSSPFSIKIPDLSRKNIVEVSFFKKPRILLCAHESIDIICDEKPKKKIRMYNAHIASLHKKAGLVTAGEDILGPILIVPKIVPVELDLSEAQKMLDCDSYDPQGLVDITIKDMLKLC